MAKKRRRPRRKANQLGFPGHVSLTSKVMVGAGVVLGALASLGFRAAAKAAPLPPALPPATPTDPAQTTDLDSSITFSGYMRKNNQCYRVTVFANGSGMSWPAPDSFCEPIP